MYFIHNFTFRHSWYVRNEIPTQPDHEYVYGSMHIPHIIISGISVAKIFIATRLEAGGADGEEYQLAGADVGNTLATARGDEKDIAGSGFTRGHVADFGAAATGQDDIAFGNALEPMPAGDHTRINPGTGDGAIRIGRGVRQFHNETAFLGPDFRCGSRKIKRLFHAQVIQPEELPYGCHSAGSGTGM